MRPFVVDRLRPNCSSSLPDFSGRSRHAAEAARRSRFLRERASRRGFAWRYEFCCLGRVLLRTLSKAMTDEHLTSRVSDTVPSKRQGLWLCWLFPQNRPAELRAGDRFGRTSDCEVQIECVAVSRQHARLFDEGGRFALRDLDSRNGTYVNGRRIAHALVAEGDVVRMGGWVGIIRHVDHEPPGVIEALGPSLFGDAAFARCIAPLRAVATSDETIALVGETGAGKETVARAIHAWSQRKGPFRVLGCAALPEYLAESELFGYEGAGQPESERTRGYLRAARGGTLLLEDIDSLPASVQAKLLHVLSTGELHLADRAAPIPIDVRLVVATQKPLRAAVATGTFREDLGALLTKRSLRLPPLRKRVAEIPELFHHFVRQCSKQEPFGVESKLVEALCLYPWPGNLRELESVASQLVALHHEASLVSWHQLPQRIRATVANRRGNEPATFPDSEATRPTLRERLDLPGALSDPSPRGASSGTPWARKLVD